MNECNAVHRTVQVKMLTHQFSLTWIKRIHDLYIPLKRLQHSKSVLSQLKVLCQNVLFEENLWTNSSRLWNMRTGSKQRVLKRLESVAADGEMIMLSGSASRLSGWLWLAVCAAVLWLFQDICCALRPRCISILISGLLVACLY